MSRLLALDQSSTHTGYCLIEDGKIVETGCINISGSKDLIDRVIEMAEDISKLINRTKPDYLCIEEIFGLPGKFTAFKALAILRGALIIVWFNYKKEHPIILNCSSSRCELGIKGNAKKPEVLSAINAKFKLKLTNEHEADAVVLGIVGYNLIKSKPKNGNGNGSKNNGKKGKK